MAAPRESRDEANGGSAARGPESEAPRRVIFRTWFVVAALMLAGAWALGRVLEPNRIGFVFSGVAFPVLTAVLMLMALGWLVWFVFSKGRR